MRASASRATRPGQVARIHIATDEPSLDLRMFHSGPEQVVTYADNQFAGVDVGIAPIHLDWTKYQSVQHSITFQIPNVPSGLYYLQFSGADGRVGYAPFVVRPAILGATDRVLVILPTNTWEAYNFQDVDGNGYGDTWYAGPPNGRVDLSRTYIARGAAPSLLPLRPPVPALALLVGQERRVHLRLRLRPDRERRPARAVRTTSSSSRGTRSTSRRTSTTSCSGSATSAAT